ncbi:MAG: hypothetical protein HY921_03435 [Elusimicrobia bacterium]|nr:hypothetical protein [Elusimicrobiota bacterium]
MKLSARAYLGIVFLAALSRLVPHPPNFTVIGSLALFGGACFEEGLMAFLVPLAALFLSDAVIGFYKEMPAVYLSFALTTILGRRMKGNRRSAQVAQLAFLSAVMFYLITNFGVWACGGMYPRTPQGLIMCYVAALPFFGNTLASTILYSAVLFGAADLADRLILATA